MMRGIYIIVSILMLTTSIPVVDSCYNQYVKVIKPNGGEVYTGAGNIIWKNCGDIHYPIFNRVFCYNTTGEYCYCIGWFNTGLGTYSHRWNTEKVRDGKYKIRVELWIDTNLDDEPDRCLAYDDSDNWFTIVNGPYQPKKPSGPTSGRPNIDYTYTTSTTHPHNRNIRYMFDWGDGTTTEWIGPYKPGETVSATHSWSETGVYIVRVRAMDSRMKISEWSDPLVVTIYNSPPNPPLINGSSTGKPNEEYYLNVSATDPDGDKVYYYIDWYDGTDSGWLGPYESGETQCFSHVFTKEGYYIIKVKTKDIYGLESDWSEFQIHIKKEKSPILYLLNPLWGNLYGIILHLLFKLDTLNSLKIR